MKTAISVEDNLLRQADQVARSMKLSRSKLISVALQDYLKRRRDQEILERLNRVYGDDPQHEEKHMAPQYKKVFSRTLRDQW